MKTSYSNQVKEYGLDIPDNWKGDLRETLLAFFKPLVDGSDVSLVINKTDSKSRLMDILKDGNKGRIGGIKALTSMECWIFLNKSNFSIVQERLGLPDNMQPNRSQPHVKVSLETVWNTLCIITGKEAYMTLEKQGIIKKLSHLKIK